MTAFCLSVCLSVCLSAYLYIFLFRIPVIISCFYNYYLGIYCIYCTRMVTLRPKELPCLVYIVADHFITAG
jgi:hypothetical protein